LHYTPNEKCAEILTSWQVKLFQVKLKHDIDKCEINLINECIHVYIIYISEYATKLMKTLCDEVVREPQKFAKVLEGINVPPPLASKYEHPDKEEAVSKWIKRFNLP
jgi:hypothetical protein